MIQPVQAEPRPGLAAPARIGPRQSGESGGSFAVALEQAQKGPDRVRFSAHAQQRLDERRITFSDADRTRIARSADLAASKGAREAVLLMDRVALIMGVPNRTVITVVEPEAGDPAVFTNIDSVVIVPPEQA